MHESVGLGRVVSVNVRRPQTVEADPRVLTTEGIDLAAAHHRPTPALLGRIAASQTVPESWRAKAERALLRQQAP